MVGPSSSGSANTSTQAGVRIDTSNQKKTTMTESQIFTCSATTLSAGWAESYLAINSSPRRDFSPFLISIAVGPEGRIVEDQDLKHALDACLEHSGLKPIETVAKTIFPQAMWNRAKSDRHKLYAAYLDSLPDFVAM